MGLECKFALDGSFSVFAGNRIILKNCYPGMDNHAVSALRAERKNDHTYRWETMRGIIEVQIERAKDCFSLVYSLEGFEKMPHTFCFFYRADACIDGFYQTAEGMGGPTGYLSKQELFDQGRADGFGLCSIKFAEGEKESALTIYSAGQDHYENIYEIEACRRNLFTDGYNINAEKGMISLSAGVRLEHVQKERIFLPPLKFLLTDQVSDGMEKAAAEIGRSMQARLSAPPAYHWCSWYYCYHNFDMKQLEEYLDGLEKMDHKPDIRYFQIDAGYCRSLGDWLEPNECFPEGLKAAFENIAGHGYIPGIWIGPFMVGSRSRLYAKHPDWVLHDLHDEPIRPLITDNEPKLWGYQDEEYYVLDTSHPDAAAYMKHIFTTLHSWGAGMFKTDFMLWGLQDSSRVKRHTPGKTSVEYFRDFLKLIRDAIGEESYWLGCIAPFIPFIGYADAMRVGDDVGSCWYGEFGPQNMMKSVVGNNYMNHNYYQTDSDAVMLRDFHIRLSDQEIKSLAMLSAVSGSCIYTSDPLHKISPGRAELFRFIQPDIRRKPALPYLTKGHSEIVMVHKSETRALIFILNTSERKEVYAYKIEELGLDTGGFLYDADLRVQVKMWNDQLVVEIEPHGYRLFVLTKKEEHLMEYRRLWDIMYS